MPFEKVEFEFPDPDKPKEKEEANVEETKVEVKAEENDVEIEVVDDTPPQDRNRKPSEPPAEVTEEELAEYSEKVKKRIQHFSKGYHDERRRAEAAQREREEAIRFAQSVTEENKKLKADREKNLAALLEQAKLRSAAELEQAKRAYKEAFETADSDKIVEAQEALTLAKIKAEKVANFKPAPLQQKETPVKQTFDAPTPPSEPQPDPKAVAWQRENTWFGTDDEMTSLALGLHQKLVREGINPQSSDYYDRINRRMRQLFPERFEADASNADEDTPPATKPRRSVVAPASRSIAPRKIVLNESQVRLAKRLGLTPEQYARQVAEDMRKQNG
jgi:hypothetical protein